MDTLEKRTAIVVEDDKGVRELIVDCLNEFANFDARGFAHAEKALRAVFDPPQQTLPDLFVVDLYLERGRMQGVEFLTELIERDVPSEILVISGAGGDDLERVIRMGVVAVARKPFDRISQVVKKMKYMAEIGRNRRIHRGMRGHDNSLGADAVRSIRPVFLSYATADKSLAMGIRRNLEASEIPVWYASSALEIGDEWRTRIDQAIRQATCFIAVVSDNYAASSYCLKELDQFLSRKQAAPPKALLLLPVLAGASERTRKHEKIASILDNYQYIDTSERFLDGLTALLGRIQRILGEQFYGDFSVRVAGSRG